MSNFARHYPHYTDKHSSHGPVVHLAGTVQEVLAPGADDGDGQHQHLRIYVKSMLPLVGNVGPFDNPTYQPDLSGQTLFLACRFGDNDANHGPIPFHAGTPIEVQGEYIDASRAYPTTGNNGSDGPILPVLHFTHAPLGFVDYQGSEYK
ncbi:hypothetical protein [Massilia putida]|uniref:hypothetical protein n=1 Tax=Massilia putida TaxID=1141883 RepID=UPI00095355F4|nr:hypothetical protein [Massilia putida]